jgi:hypothetical protein
MVIVSHSLQIDALLVSFGTWTKNFSEISSVGDTI